VIVEPVTIQSETDHWVELRIDKGCLVVLPREQFVEGLRLGKRWRRGATMKARLRAHDEGEGGRQRRVSGDLR
jgi:hypothetical protein